MPITPVARLPLPIFPMFIKTRIYILGNPLVKKDSLPRKITLLLEKKFPSFDFIRYDPTEDLPENLNHFIAIDIVEGISKVKVFKSSDEFLPPPRFSAHDFDAYHNLLLYKKLGKIAKFTIIGLPENGDLKEIIRRVSEIISSMKL